MSSSTFTEHDPFAPIKYVYPIEDVLCSLQTNYSSIKVLNSSYFGKIFVLNDVVQLTEWDEHIYHEMLVHVPLHIHPSPSEILIIVGGDGGSLREVLKHDNVKRVMLVEIDEKVIEVSKNFLPTLSTGFSDTRTQVIIMDGNEFLSGTTEKFDVIIIDSTDPVGAAESLFTDNFFTNAYSALNANGIFAAQTESLHFHQQFICDIQHKLISKFRYVNLYTAPIATYAGNWWTFSIASKKHDPMETTKECEVPTKYYAEDVHRQAFLPKSLYRKIINCQSA